MVLIKFKRVRTWNTRPGLHGPEKVVVEMVKVPSDGTSSTADSTAQAALHAARKASVSSAVLSPVAPYARTSNTHGSGRNGVAGSDGTMPPGGGARGDASSSGGTAGDDATVPTFAPTLLCREPAPARGGFLCTWLLPSTPTPSNAISTSIASINCSRPSLAAAMARERRRGPPGYTKQEEMGV